MSYRKLFYVANVLLLAVFVWALVEDFRAEWRPYQAAYYRMAAEAQEKLAAAQTDPKKAAEHKAAARAMQFAADGDLPACLEALRKADDALLSRIATRLEG